MQPALAPRTASSSSNMPQVSSQEYPGSLLRFLLCAVASMPFEAPIMHTMVDVLGNSRGRGTQEPVNIHPTSSRRMNGNR